MGEAQGSSKDSSVLLWATNANSVFKMCSERKDWPWNREETYKVIVVTYKQAAKFSLARKRVFFLLCLTKRNTSENPFDNMVPPQRSHG